MAAATLFDAVEFWGDISLFFIGIKKLLLHSHMYSRKYINMGLTFLGKSKRIYLDQNEDVKTGFRSQILNYFDISDL